MLAAWLRDVSPAEFHRTLDRCSRLPEGFAEYYGITPEWTRTMESLLDEIDEMDRGGGLVERDGRNAPVEPGSGSVVVGMGGRRRWMVAAAAMLLLSVGAAFWLKQRSASSPMPLAAHGKQDVAPGHDGAILTLANGQQIVLDSAGNGSLAMEGAVRIQKLGNGELKYEGRQGSTEVVYNTLTTPRGRKTSLSLTDGTMVWLNASSSIRYPTVFTGKERVVEVSGEAYFEVARDARMPFIVKRAGSDERVEVLGTSFDMNAYEDEDAARTTLLEGSVRVVKGSGNQVLKPGQQAVLSKGEGGIKVVSDVDAEEVMAWKNGHFQFNDTELKAIMRQLMRWYDVEVIYEGNVPERYFTGDVSRNKNLSSVLKMLELSKVHFRIEGRKLIVAP